MRPLGSDHTAIEALRFQAGYEPKKDFIGMRPDTMCNYHCVSCHQRAGKGAVSGYRLILGA
ncbi:MAG: hypothetical protein UT32_C0022G0009 [Parcubacteria group bacterium GW2011_GWC2_39_14]|nr:MAG: hypothetical protein UT32_C0022G0009 [Parcubacteria group bacterium GW2011_GWC2_39_14]KKR53815.1 MAG: hypothetical protein UT91_C0023G0009 [Parcubacteria group bacterium GW2011_GWA2_40_23]